MKIIKLHLLNSTNYIGTQIYCIKHEKGEDLTVLKEKIFLRCPLLKSLTHEPQIYWFDFEKDRIMVTCDDDLKFFIEESEVKKLFIDFGFCQQEMSRKRHITTDDECSESSKRIRRKLEQIDLDSSDSSMDTTDELNIENELVEVSAEQKIDVTSSNIDETVPSTSESSQNNSPNVNILSVEIIQQPNDEAENDNIPEQGQGSIDQNTADNQNTSQKVSNEKKINKNSDSNKIIISDSSDDEEEASRRNRRHSDGNYSSSYSFAGATTNNARFESRASFDDDFRQFYNRRHQQFRYRFRDAHLARVLRNAENIRMNTLRNAEEIRENALRNAETIRENAMRNIRNSTNNIFPHILQTFQAHFRPLFQAQSYRTDYSRVYRQ